MGWSLWEHSQLSLWEPCNTRNTIQVVAHTWLVNDLHSKLEDTGRHVGRARTYRAKVGGVTINRASQGKQLGQKPEPGTVTLMLRGRKLRH